MKKNIFYLLTILLINSALADDKNALDYCSKVNAWPASRMISEAVKNNALLDGSRASSKILSTTPVTENNKPVNAGIWGPIYLQIIKLSIPYKLPNQTQEVELIVSSFISAQECSIAEPSYMNLTELKKIR